MKRFIVFLVGFMVLTFASFGWAANTVTPSSLDSDAQNAVTISAIDSDWDGMTNYWSNPQYRKGVRVRSIMFYPAATNDKCIIKNETDAGSPIFSVIAADAYDQRGWNYDCTLLKPYLDFSAGVYTAGSYVTIILCPDQGRP